MDPSVIVSDKCPVVTMRSGDELAVEPEGELGPEWVSPVVEPESELGFDAVVCPPEQQILKDSVGGEESPAAQLIVLHSSSDPW